MIDIPACVPLDHAESLGDDIAFYEEFDGMLYHVNYLTHCRCGNRVHIEDVNNFNDCADCAKAADAWARQSRP